MKIKIAYFEITSRCNLNCATCYNRSGHNKELKEISVDRLRRSIDFLLPLGLRRVLISGGEPTLHSDFGGVLDLIGEYPALSFGFVTNGTVHNERLIGIINENERVTLQISLDGSCEEQNVATRGPGNFRKALDFAKKIRKENPKPLLKMVISQTNIDDAEPFYRLAVPLGFLPEFAFIYKSGNANDSWEKKALSARQKLDVLRLVDRLNAELQTEAQLPLCANSCPYLEGADEMSVCIKTDGSLQPCQTMYDGRFSLGNLFDFDLPAIEESACNFIDMIRKREQADFACGRCILRGNCGKGCMAAAVNLCGDPFGDDGGCELRRLQFLGYDLKFPNRD